MLMGGLFVGRQGACWGLKEVFLATKYVWGCGGYCMGTLWESLCGMMAFVLVVA